MNLKTTDDREFWPRLGRFAGTTCHFSRAKPSPESFEKKKSPEVKHLEDFSAEGLQ